MLRFTATVVTKAARRTFATTAIGSHTTVGLASRNDVENTCAKTVGAAGSSLPGLVCPQEVLLDFASSKTDFDAQQQLRDELTALRKKCKRLEEETKTLKEEVERTAREKALEAKLLLVSQALELADKDFQRRLNFRGSLLYVWQSPDNELDAESLLALKGFFEANEKWLPERMRMKFFFAWREIRQQCTYVPVRREDVRLKRDELKAAVDMCCEEMGDDVCATVLEVILRSVGRE